MNASPYAIGWLIKEEIRSALKVSIYLVHHPDSTEYQGLTFFEASCEAAYLISLWPRRPRPSILSQMCQSICDCVNTYVLSNRGTWIIINLKSADVKFEFET